MYMYEQIYTYQGRELSLMDYKQLSFLLSLFSFFWLNLEVVEDTFKSVALFSP